MSRATVLFSIGLCLSLISTASAQTFTSCQPLNTTCPPDLALGIKNYTIDFTTPLDSSIWNTTNGHVINNSSGINFVINERLDSPTIQSMFYIMFGTVEVHMKAATGQGIISSIVLESDDLDEIDWEWMGGAQTKGETNYFGKGHQNFTQATYYPINGPMTEFHNYTLDWNAERILWILDGTVVRTLTYAEADGGAQYPQTPMTLRFGIWAGGDESLPPGTIAWAGGKTDYSQAPFTMQVQSAKVSDAGTGQTYTYSDHTGSFSSIKSISGNSTVAQTIIAGPPPPPLTMAQKWAALSNTAHIGVIAGGSVGIALFAGLLALCCIQRRRRGRKDRAEAQKRLDDQRREDAQYDGIPLKDQDKFTTGIHTTSEYNTEHSGYSNSKGLSVDTAESNSLLKEGGFSQPPTPLPAPAYQNPGFGSRSNSPSTVTPPVYSGGGGYASQTRSPVSQVRSPVSAVGNANSFNFSNNSSSRGMASPGPGYAAPARSGSGYSQGRPGNAYSSNGVHPGNNF